MSWLLVASVALSTLLQIAVAPPTMVLSLLYRAEVSADQATAAAELSAEPAPASADPAHAARQRQRQASKR